MYFFQGTGIFLFFWLIYVNLFTSKHLNLLMKNSPAIETKLLVSTNRIYENIYGEANFKKGAALLKRKVIQTGWRKLFFKHAYRFGR